MEETSSTPALGLTDHKSSPQFSDLSLELRLEVWRLTIGPRVVEMSYADHKDGFYSRTNMPVALRVNQESRNAVLPFYQECFGNRVYEASTRFNFEIDTLLVTNSLIEHALLFFTSLTSDELVGLKYVAIDGVLGFEDGESGYEVDLTWILKKMIPHMTSVTELQIVDDISLENSGVQCGKGPMKLFGATWPSDAHCQGSTKNEYPQHPDCRCLWPVDRYTSEFGWLQGPTLRGVYGWRPTEDWLDRFPDHDTPSFNATMGPSHSVQATLGPSDSLEEEEDEEDLEI